jgi:hypothetical protein
VITARATPNKSPMDMNYSNSRNHSPKDFLTTLQKKKELKSLEIDSKNQVKKGTFEKESQEHFSP